MGNLFLYIIFGIEAVIGAFSSLYIVVSLVFVIFQKLYRKIRYGASLYD